jgi:hypothetical protein
MGRDKGWNVDGAGRAVGIDREVVDAGDSNLKFVMNVVMKLATRASGITSDREA